MTDAVIATEDLSTEILVNLFRDGLLAAAAGPDPLTDPKEADRATANGAPFVMTSFPSRNPYYPHIIVEQANDQRDRIDRRSALMAGLYQVRLDIYSASRTDRNRIRDQVKKWILDNVQVLQDAGFAEAQIISDTDADWDETSKVHVWRLVVQGLVHTI